MRRVLSTSEMLDHVKIEGRTWELLAMAEAFYDDAQSVLEITLDTELRPQNGPLPAGVRVPKPEWLPKRTCQRESVSVEEAISVAKDMFHAWVRKLRRVLTEYRSQSNP